MNSSLPVGRACDRKAEPGISAGPSLCSALSFGQNHRPRLASTGSFLAPAIGCAGSNEWAALPALRAAPPAFGCGVPADTALLAAESAERPTAAFTAPADTTIHPAQSPTIPALPTAAPIKSLPAPGNPATAPANSPCRPALAWLAPAKPELPPAGRWIHFLTPKHTPAQRFTCLAPLRRCFRRVRAKTGRGRKGAAPQRSVGGTPAAMGVLWKRGTSFVPCVLVRPISIPPIRLPL